MCLCQECGKTFTDDIDCAQHQAAKGHKGMARVNDDEDGSAGWDCGQCGKRFDSERAAEMHQQSTGHGDFPMCITCGRAFGFGDMQALLQHQQAKGHVGIQWGLDISSDSDDEEDRLQTALMMEAARHNPMLAQLTGPAYQHFLRVNGFK